MQAWRITIISGVTEVRESFPSNFFWIILPKVRLNNLDHKLLIIRLLPILYSRKDLTMETLSNGLITALTLILEYPREVFFLK